MNSFEQIWESILNQLKLTITSTAFDLWISPLNFVTFDDDTIVLSIAEPFKRNIIMSKFLDKLQEAAKEVFGFDVNFNIIIEGETIEEKPKKSVNTMDIEESLTFDNFIQGPSNSFAYSAAFNVAENPGEHYNPLFIYGPSGVGKTHLMNAIMNKIKSNNPNAVILYYTGEHFMNEFISCLKNETNLAFREKYRKCDALLLDDIQYIAGKVQTQDEFFHTFNTLKENGKQICLTSDVAPRNLKGLPDRLVSRFEEGILADISAPELETRIAIVKRKAEDLNVKIPDDIALFIAENIKKNIRQLEGIVKRIRAYVEFTGNPINLPITKGFIDEISSEKLPIEAKLELIINEVCRVYNITADEIRSDRRNSSVVLPRQIAMYIMSKETSMTQNEIGQYFSGKDHATVIYAIRTLKTKMETDHSIKATIDEIIANINS